MMQSIENFVFRKAAPMAVKRISRPDLNSEDEVAAKVLEQAEVEFQVAPPLTVHISDPDLLAGVWHGLRESYVVGARKRAMREAVAASISQINKCAYCETVHSSMFVSAGGSSTDLYNSETLSPEIAAAQLWALETLTPNSEIIQQPSINPEDIAQVYATAIMFHYINRVVAVFLEDSPIALPGTTTIIGEKLARRAFAFLSKRMASQDPVAGQCVWQVKADLPKVFEWARSKPELANALAHFSWSVEKAGKESVAPEVRLLVLDHLGSWRGQHAPISRSWVEEAIEPLEAHHKPAGRLALLTARAAFQIDDTVVSEFQTMTPGDKHLLQTVAWASYAATAQIASWFKNPQR